MSAEPRLGEDGVDRDQEISVDDTPEAPSYEMHEKNYYLLILAYALVEIRSGESVKSAIAIADMLHHLPEALRLEWNEDRDSRVHDQLRTKAEVHGLAHLLDGWERAAEKRCAAGG